MRIDEIRNLNDEQLVQELENARREVFNLRFRAVTRQLSSTHEVGGARKKVARILTVMRERDLAAAASEQEA